MTARPSAAQLPAPSGNLTEVIALGGGEELPVEGCVRIKFSQILCTAMTSDMCHIESSPAPVGASVMHVRISRNLCLIARVSRDRQCVLALTVLIGLGIHFGMRRRSAQSASEAFFEFAKVQHLTKFLYQHIHAVASCPTSLRRTVPEALALDTRPSKRGSCTRVQH